MTILPENTWTITDTRRDPTDTSYLDHPAHYWTENLMKMIEHDLDQLNRLDTYFRCTDPMREAAKVKLNAMKERIK